MTYWYPGVSEAVRIRARNFSEAYRSGWRHIRGALSGSCRTVQWGRPHVTGVSVLPKIISEATGFQVRNQTRGAISRPGPFRPSTCSNPGLDYAPILTGIGCPYRCPFCASRKASAQRARFGAERIFNEIARDHYDFGVSDFAFYDDALLLDADIRSGLSLERIAHEGPAFRFHAPNALMSARFPGTGARCCMRQGSKPLARTGNRR